MNTSKWVGIDTDGGGCCLHWLSFVNLNCFLSLPSATPGILAVF